MGGFAGGDEGGYWDDSPSIEMNKENNKLKRTKKEKPYIHISDSGYSMKVQIGGNLYNSISFVASKCETFTIEDCDGISLESSKIYQAYTALCDFTNDSDIVDFFFEHKIVLTKEESSDAAAFLYLTKEICNLVLSTDELVRIGTSIGVDLDFFKY